MTLLQLLHDTWQYAMDCISAQRRALFDGLFHYCYETLDHVHHRFLHGEQEESVVSERTYRQKPSPATQDSISKGRQKALLIGINYKLSPERHGYSEPTNLSLFQREIYDTIHELIGVFDNTLLAKLPLLILQCS